MDVDNRWGPPPSSRFTIVRSFDDCGDFDGGHDGGYDGGYDGSYDGSYDDCDDGDEYVDSANDEYQQLQFRPRPQPKPRPQRANPKNNVTNVILACTREGECRSSSRMVRFMYWASTKVMREYIHCELLFVFEHGQRVSFRVVYGETVGAKLWGPDENPYSTQDYEGFGLVISTNGANRLYRFCCGQKGKPFNRSGFWLNFIPFLKNWFAVNQRGEAWFCSEFIITALQTVFPVLGQYEGYRVSPQALRDILSDHNLLTADSWIQPNADDISLV